MPILPETTLPTLKDIHDIREMRGNDDYEGYGFGMSDVDNDCPRALWYKFRWSSPKEKFSARMLRLFATGHLEEKRLLDDLSMIPGVDVRRVDDKTGRQWKVKIEGIIRGAMDAVALGLPEAPKTWHVVECKSSNSKTFQAIKKKGVKAGKLGHWLQMQLYMHSEGLKRALYMLVNKDDDDEYFERVHYDVEAALATIERLRSIAFSPMPPPRLHDDPEDKKAWQCRFCNHRQICHELQFSRTNCRTCLHSTPLRDNDDANWRCERHNKTITPAEQRVGCPHHLFIPDLVPGEQIDADEEAETVTYKMADGSYWLDGREGERG